MITSTRRQNCINIDIAVAVSRRRSHHRSFFFHVSRSRSSASSSSSSLNSSVSLNVLLRRIDLKQIVETLTTLVMWQRIKDIHQVNMKHKLKQKLRRLEAQSTALNQSRNNSVIKNTISQTSEFWAVNVFKLINDHISNSINKQDLQLSRIDELRAYDDDITQQNLKNMILFLRCLKVYNQCFIEMINDQLRHSLQASLTWYIDYLQKLHLHYIFEFLRIFHFHFHEIHIVKEVNDLNEWYNAEDELVDWALIKKTSAITFQIKYQSQKIRKQFYDLRFKETSTKLSVCNKFNDDSCIYSSCTYQHICSECDETYAAINCKTSNSNSQSIIKKRWRWILISLILILKFFSYQLMKIDEISLTRRDSLDASAWQTQLIEHFDCRYVQTLLFIIEHEAKIEYQDLNQLILSKNLLSTNEASNTLQINLMQQVHCDRLIEIQHVSHRFIFSSLRLVSKENDRWHWIHYLSYLKEKSVNCFILKNWESIEYFIFDQAIITLCNVDRNAVFIKRDLIDVFHHMSIATSDHWLLDFFWKDKYWIKYFLLFDLHTSSYLFDLFAKDLCWMLIVTLQWDSIIHYLNDFLVIQVNMIEARKYESDFDDLCTQLKFSINLKKNLIDITCIFLSIELDSINMMTHLSSDKHQKTIQLVNSALTKSSLLYEKLQMLLDFLSFAAKIVVSERIFLRWLFNDLIIIKSRKQRINYLMWQDLLWWKMFLSKWNDVHLLCKCKFRHSLYLWINASDLHDMRNYYLLHLNLSSAASQTFSNRFNMRLSDKHINVKEMMTVLHALTAWLSVFAKCNLTIYDDNVTVVVDINKIFMREETMLHLRWIVLLTTAHDICIHALWILIHENRLADLLSRAKFSTIADEFSQLTTLQSISASRWTSDTARFLLII